MKKNFLLASATLTAHLSISACSSSKSDSSSASSCLSNPPGNTGGYVLCLGSATSASIELAGESGQKYVVAPYTLGDIATIKGADATKLPFKMTATSASLQLLKNPHFSLDDDIAPAASMSESMRLVVNHFDRSRGLNQPEWIWSSLKRLDQEANIKSQLFEPSKPRLSLESHFKSIAKQSVAFNSEALDMPLTLGNCPTSIPKVDNAAATFTATSAYDGTSFCVVYASDPTSESKTNLQSSIATILAAYKDNIYADQFTANTANGYSFNPVIVVIDPTDSSMWPAGNTSYNFVGAFSRDATTAAKRPIIFLVDYVPSVQAGTDAAKSARLMHATLAHEMQHAIMDYYRNRGATQKEETVAIDEGIAHLFEDAFGYGVDNFTSYVQTFLTSVPDGPDTGTAVLSASDASQASARGGANAFLYFLAERVGGFSVANNRPFSGAGLSAIVNLVKQTNVTGPAALQAAFGSQNLTEQLGQFFGAIFSDNKSLSFAPAVFGVNTYSGIADLQGSKDKTFGFHFNNFQTFSSSVGMNSLADAAEFELKYYGTNPVLITPSAATSTVTLTLPASSNNGVAVIRVN